MGGIKTRGKQGNPFAIGHRHMLCPRRMSPMMQARECSGATHGRWLRREGAGFACAAEKRNLCAKALHGHINGKWFAGAATGFVFSDEWSLSSPDVAVRAGLLTRKWWAKNPARNSYESSSSHLHF